jgi:hypothetical protein
MTGRAANPHPRIGATASVRVTGLPENIECGALHLHSCGRDVSRRHDERVSRDQNISPFGDEISADIVASGQFRPPHLGHIVFGQPSPIEHSQFAAHERHSAPASLQAGHQPNTSARFPTQQFYERRNNSQRQRASYALFAGTSHAAIVMARVLQPIRYAS